MRKTFSDFTQALTIRTRGPVEPVVGAESRHIMQGEAKRATSAPTGNPWTYQWCKPCHLFAASTGVSAALDNAESQPASHQRSYATAPAQSHPGLSRSIRAVFGPFASAVLARYG